VSVISLDEAYAVASADWMKEATQKQLGRTTAKQHRISFGGSNGRIVTAHFLQSRLA
jgi:hypothetical protein